MPCLYKETVDDILHIDPTIRKTDVLRIVSTGKTLKTTISL